MFFTFVRPYCHPYGILLISLLFFYHNVIPTGFFTENFSLARIIRSGSGKSRRDDIMVAGHVSEDVESHRDDIIGGAVAKLKWSQKMTSNKETEGIFHSVSGDCGFQPGYTELPSTNAMNSSARPSEQGGWWWKRPAKRHSMKC